MRLMPGARSMVVVAQLKFYVSVRAQADLVSDELLAPVESLASVFDLEEFPRIFHFRLQNGGPDIVNGEAADSL